MVALPPLNLNNTQSVAQNPYSTSYNASDFIIGGGKGQGSFIEKILPYVVVGLLIFVVLKRK